MAAVQNTEEDVRLKMLNTFMSCTHRDTDSIKEVHKELQVADPVFYAHLACWYRKNGELRDHNEVFTALLLTDAFNDNREVGLGLFQDQALYMKRKILGFIKGKTVKIRTKTGKKIMVKGKSVAEVTNQEKVVGLKKNVPNSLKTEIRKYVQWLEADATRFDAAVLRNKDDLKSLYASLKIKPSARANDILFKGVIPTDSKLNVFEEIANSKSAKQTASLIVENKIPYTTAIGLVDNITPTILVALINSMSPQEVINNIASLEEKGALKNADTKALIESKLEKAKTSKSVSTMKSKTAVDTGRVQDEGISKKLEDVTDTQVRTKGSIQVPTAIFVDKSGSMEVAIEVGKKVAAMISGATTADLHVIAFDAMPRNIVAKGVHLSDWEKAFAPINAQGGTSIGSALELLRREKKVVEQIIVITDEEENADPYFHNIYPSYCREFGCKPNIVLINPRGNPSGRAGAFSTLLSRVGIEFDRYTPEANDYYGLPGLLQLLSKKSKFDLLLEIMSTPLKKKKSY